MIGKASGNSRCSRDPLVAADDTGQAQAFMRRAEVVDTTHQVHQWLQGFRVAKQSSAASCQGCQARTKGGIQSFDESRVELGSAATFGQQDLSHFQTAQCHAFDDINDALALVTLDHLTDMESGQEINRGRPGLPLCSGLRNTR